MAFKMLSASLLLFVGSVAAKTCQNITIPVDINSRQALFNKVPVEGNLDVTAFSQDITQHGRNYSATLLKEYYNLIGSYKISAKFCHPDGGIKGSIVQVMSHGIGFDKTYWDLSYNNYNYSYVEKAVAAGFSTLAIDRFGIGNSSHGDPFNVVQAQAEVEALNAITTKLRLGQISEIKQKFEKVVHVGHSFGAVQSYWLSSLYPNNTDGLILTGWSADGSFIGSTIAGWNLHSARLNQPLRFGDYSNEGLRKPFGRYFSAETLIEGVKALLRTVGIKASSFDIWNEIATTEIGDIIYGYNKTVPRLNYPSGYFAHSSLTANQFVFLRAGKYDIGLAVASEQTKQPMTAGELLTIGNAPPQTSFDGPVLVITGDADQPFCGGDCYATDGTAPSIPAQAEKLFPKASPFEAYIQPQTGHGLNAHYNSTGGYAVMLNFLKAHGLGGY